MASPRMIIRRLRLEGGADEAVYDFGPGTNVIVGAVGTGKSSLLELIKYTFGGTGVLSGAVLEGVTSSVLEVDIAGSRYLMRRAIGDRQVEIRSGISGALIERCHIIGTKTERRISDALLELLRLPQLEVPRSRVKPTADTTSISFFDVLGYMYARQIEIDRSVVYHLDPLREPKRHATFEMLYGLTDEAVAAIHREIGVLHSTIDDARRRNRHIDAFLREADDRTEDQLRVDLEASEVQARLADERVSALRIGIRSQTPFVDEERGELTAQETALGDAKQEELVASADGARLEALAAQLELDLHRINRSLVAGEIIGPLEYVVCPRCQQSIRDRARIPSLCVLCGQTQNAEDAEVRLEQERSRIRDQINETVGLQTRSLDQIARARRTVVQLTTSIDELRARIDAETSTFVSPLMSEIESASSELERIRSHQMVIRRSLDLWHRFREGLGEVKRLESRLEALQRDLSEAQAGLEAARKRVTLLSELFDEMLRDFRYPWYQSARIDEATYLPVVNDEPFDRASGGMKTLINVAYYLAGLRYGLRYGDSLLPLFLMIDSPRKNLGAENVDDKLIGSQIYRRFWAMQGANPDDFQLIVADNDLPVDPDDFRVVKLDYEHPLVPWVHHPGPDQVEPIE